MQGRSPEALGKTGVDDLHCKVFELTSRHAITVIPFSFFGISSSPLRQVLV